MPTFEVHIPAADPSGFNVTLKVSADNWMAALKAGMQKLGEQGANSQNVMVDIQDDNSIHITEAITGRVFRIRELTAVEVSKAAVKRPSQIRPLPPEVAALRGEVKTAPAAPAAPAVDPYSAKTMIGAPEGAPQATQKVPAYVPQAPPAPAAAPPAAAPTEPPPPKYAVVQPAPPPPPPAPVRRPTQEQPTDPARPSQAAPTITERPGQPGQQPPPRGFHPGKSSPRMEMGTVEELERPIAPVVGPIGRVRSTPGQAAVLKQSVEDVLADVFIRVNELAGKTSVEDAMNLLMDLALEKVPCEAGSVFRADGATGDLSFIVARGPKARELLAANIVIPAGRGIASFCASEGVSVAVSDVEKDPRFYAAVGEKVDFETRSLLCVPMMTHGRSFGCVQVINRKSGQHFLEHEVGILSYIAHQGALWLNDRL